MSTPGSKLDPPVPEPGRLHGALRGDQRRGCAKVEKVAARKGLHRESAPTPCAPTCAAPPRASAINSAFGVQLKLYRASPKSVNAGPYRLRANNRAVTVPAAPSPSSVLGVTGLDNAAPALPLLRPWPACRRAGCRQGLRRSRPRARSTTPSTSSTSCPRNSAAGRSRPTAAGTAPASYGAPTSRPGKRRPGPDDCPGGAGPGAEHVQDTARLRGGPNHIAAPSARPLRGAVARARLGLREPFDIEEQLDVEASYDMAPSANQLVVGGDSCNEGDFGLCRACSTPTWRS